MSGLHEAEADVRARLQVVLGRPTVELVTQCEMLRVFVRQTAWRGS